MQSLRWKRHLYPECEDCVYLRRKKCQGSCLCHKCAPFYINDYNDFDVYSQYKLHEVQGFIASIKKATQLLRQRFGSLKKKPRIYIFKDKEEMKFYSCVDFYPDWVTGFVANGVYYQYGTSIAEKRIVHELCHIFVSDISENMQLPNWFAEGVCEYVAFGDAVDATLVELMKRKKLIPFQEMSGRYKFSVLEFDKDPIDDNIAHQQSASMVKFIVRKYGFPSILKILREKGDFYKAFKRITNKDFYELEKEWLVKFCF